MNSEWDCLRLAAKATDREKLFRDHWPAVEAQLGQWGYPSWGSGKPTWCCPVAGA